MGPSGRQFRQGIHRVRDVRCQEIPMTSPKRSDGVGGDSGTVPGESAPVDSDDPKPTLSGHADDCEARGGFDYCPCTCDYWERIAKWNAWVARQSR